MGWKSAWSTMLSSWEVVSFEVEELVVMTMLKVRWRTEVKEMLSIVAKGKKVTGFLKPNTMPVERR
jgi:hypothetical protein